MAAGNAEYFGQAVQTDIRIAIMALHPLQQGGELFHIAGYGNAAGLSEFAQKTKEPISFSGYLQPEQIVAGIQLLKH
ncbi:hypothetical protein D3C76_1581210 [compost metagenome]